MFQTAELGQRVSKSEFKQRELILREDLLALQQRLRTEGKFPVILDFAGVRGAGRRNRSGGHLRAGEHQRRGGGGLGHSDGDGHCLRAGRAFTARKACSNGVESLPAECRHLRRSRPLPPGARQRQ